MHVCASEVDTSGFCIHICQYPLNTKSVGIDFDSVLRYKHGSENGRHPPINAKLVGQQSSKFMRML